MITQGYVRVDGHKLRRLRQRHVWLIGDLAEHSGVHRNTISKLDNNRGGAYPESVKKLARALEIEPRELIAEEEE